MSVTRPFFVGLLCYNILTLFFENYEHVMFASKTRRVGRPPCLWALSSLCRSNFCLCSVSQLAPLKEAFSYSNLHHVVRVCALLLTCHLLSAAHIPGTLKTSTYLKLFLWMSRSSCHSATRTASSFNVFVIRLCQRPCSCSPDIMRPS